MTLKTLIRFALALIKLMIFTIEPSNYNKIIKNKITDANKLDWYNTLSEMNNDTEKMLVN